MKIEKRLYLKYLNENKKNNDWYGGGWLIFFLSSLKLVAYI